MENKEEIKDAESSAREGVDLNERKPGEGAEDMEGQGNTASALSAPWSPNQEFVKALLDMGVSKNAAEKVKSKTMLIGNSCALYLIVHLV